VTLPELAPADIGPYFAVVQRVAAAVPEALGADGSFVALNNVVSQSVAHLHTHVVPRRRKDGLRGFFWPRTRYHDAAEMEAFASVIRAALS
jgi:histidine triad (HIT) family protein